MFEEASKLKLRFNTSKGTVTVEDLWDMPLTSRKAGVSLDDLAKAYNKAVKDSGEESFVVKKSSTNTVLNLQFDIIKHVIAVKLNEAETKSKAAEKKAQKDKILQIIADKQDESLKGKTLEELESMATAL